MIDKLKNVPKILLMGLNPSYVHPEVFKALAVSTLGHTDPDRSNLYRYNPRRISKKKMTEFLEKAWEEKDSLEYIFT